MSAAVLRDTLWLVVTMASLWDMRRTHRSMQESLERMEQASREISQSLGSDCR
jgi:hypothetical protein